MNAFNSFFSTIFGVLLAPFGAEKNWSAWIDILLWSIVGGAVAMVVYKYASNQKGIERAKNDIKVHLLEIRLFKDDIGTVLSSTAKILAKNMVYLGHNLLPLAVMFVPFMAILIQLVATYGYDPVEPGTVQLFKVRLDPAYTDVAVEDVTLELPPGVVLEAGPVRTADAAIAWRLRAEQPGDHVLRFQVGDEVYEKGLSVGGDARRVPIKRTKSLEGLLFPGEPQFASDSPVALAELSYPSRDLGWMPGGEPGILGVFFVVSILAGLALKGVLGVTL